MNGSNSYFMDAGSGMSMMYYMMLCMYDVVCFANSTLEKENFGNFNVLREMQSFGTM